MSKSILSKESENVQPEEKIKTPAETKQEQSDPNLTELKGFIDPKEKLEPEGTDNDV